MPVPCHSLKMHHIDRSMFRHGPSAALERHWHRQLWTQPSFKQLLIQVLKGLMAGVAEHPVKSDELSTFSCTLLEMDENKKLLPRVRKKGTKLPRMLKKADDFVFLRILGEGAYSTVYLVREISGEQIRAAKVVEKDFINRHQKMAAIIREKNILASLTYEQGGHPFVIQLYCTFHDSQRLYFVTDVAERGDLLDALNRLGTFDIPSARFYAAEIVVALEFIHSHGVVHRDLKPENVLIRRSGHIMLTDFGSAQIYDEKLFVHYEEEKDDTSTQVGKLEQERNDSEAPAEASNDSSSETEDDGAEVPDRPRRATFVGTAQYVSPEMLRGEEVGPPCDYWALGAIIYQLISGQAPFRAINDFHLMNKIQKLDLSFPDDFPDLVKDLVAKLLVLDPAVRLGTENLTSLKSHKFFDGTDWISIANTTPPDILPPMSKSMGEVEMNPDVLIQPGLDEKALGRLMNSSLLGIELEQPYLDSQDPYSTVKSSSSTTFGRDSLATRDRKLEKQRKENPYHPFVQENLIIRSGFIDKKKGLFARRRMFLLTEGPHLFYVDPNSMELKGEVPWSPCMRAEAKNFRAFWVYTPKRIYYLFDPESRALEWCKAIEQMKTRYADEIAESYEKAVRDGTFGVNAYKKSGNYFGNKRRKGRNRSQV